MNLDTISKTPKAKKTRLPDLEQCTDLSEALTQDSEIEVVDGCQIEWNKRLGILYVHGGEAQGGRALVRIQGLPATRNHINLSHANGGMIDVRAGEGMVSVPLH